MEPTLEIEIDARSTNKLVHSGEVNLLDCRELAEWQAARIEAAKLIPMGEIPGRLAELSEWSHQRVVVVCHHGMRSLMVAEWLRQQGFAQAQSMAGGIDAWSVEIDPQVPRY